LGQDAVVDDLAMRLRLLGAVLPSSILVVGLHSSDAAACATRAIAAACAAGGMDVRTEDHRGEGQATVSDTARSMSILAHEAGKDIVVRDVGLVSRNLDWFQISQDLNVLVCAVVPGEASETLLARLDAEAAGCRVAQMLFIICDV
jgi:hypothetical protein